MRRPPQVVQSDRSDGGQRRDSRNEIACIGRMSEMAGEGMTLAGIRRILTLEAELATLKLQLGAANRRRNATPKP